jgi:hypothetical protein
MIGVAAAILVACYSSALASPAATNLLANHPALAGYVALAAGVLVAIANALGDRNAAAAAAEVPPSTGSSMAAK